MEVLRIPMVLKYKCPAPTLWRRAVLTFVSVVHAVVSGARLHATVADPDEAVRERTTRVWDTIIHVLEDALFSVVPAPAELSAEERSSDAALDVELVHLVRDALLKPPGGVAAPPGFEPYNAKLYALLSRATAHQEDGGSGPGNNRIDLARESFQTLLDVSLHESDGSGMGMNQATPPRSASMDALLQSCEDVLKKYLADEATGAVMRRERTEEAVYMIEAVKPIISPARRQVALSLYTILCKMCVCRAIEIRKPLAEVLLLYHDLMGSK
jgi:hypothetical protein